MGPVFLVGRSSFIARHVLAALPPGALGCAFTHGEALAEGAAALRDLPAGAALINCAIHPAYRQGPCGPAEDVDRQLIDAIRDRDVHYVLLSSRKVYAPSAQWGASEDAPLEGVDAYGRNKLGTERHLLGSLPPARRTVLRLGNVFGYEHEPGRGSFLGQALGRLARRGEICLDVGPFVPRDFVSVERAARVIARAAAERVAGVFNLGSGTPLLTGEVALWLIEGFGRGELRVTSPRHHDAFCLDVARLRAAFGPTEGRDELRAALVGIGRRLAAEAA